MPKGVPNLLGVIKYPTIEQLGQEIGKKRVLLMILALVRDMCDSLNVVRNMSEDQMIEAASMLLDESDNFRLEDYVMMFSMAKRGQLVKIFDRIDIDLVGEILNVYWQKRNEAGRRHQEDQFREFEEDLRRIERAPAKYLKEGETLDDGLMEKIKDLTQKMTSGIRSEDTKNYDARDERIRKRQEMIMGTLTPEQQQEMAEIRKRYVPTMNKQDNSEVGIDSSERTPTSSEK